MNGVRKVTAPDEELKIIVFSPFPLHYINEVLRLLTSSRLEGVVTCARCTRFPPVEFSLTFSTVDLDFYMSPASSELVLTFFPFTRSPVFVFPGARLPIVVHEFQKKN